MSAKRSAATMTLRFVDVGRGKKTWTETFPTRGATESILESIRKSGALASRGVEFVLDLDAGTGQIIVGLVRCVGRIEVIR